MGRRMDRIMVLSLEQVLPLITSYKKPESRPLVFGHECHTNGLRLFTFKAKGTKCVACGLQATHFAMEKTFGVKEYPHLNLYAESPNGDVLFTHDHTLARSLGGADVLENAQTMCQPCNGNKAKGEQKELNRRLHAMGKHPSQIAARKRQLEKLVGQMEDPKNLALRAKSLIDSENGLLALISRGGTPTGNLSVFTHRAEHALFTGEEAWDKIKAVLVEKRGYNPEGVIYGSKIERIGESPRE